MEFLEAIGDDTGLRFAMIGSLTALIGLSLIVYVWRTYRRSKDTSRWIQTWGTVIESDMVIETGSKGGRMYGARIRYRYRHDGEDNESERFSQTGMMFTASSPTLAENRLENYPPGKEVTVYIDRKNPKRVCLDITMTASLWLFFIIGLFFLGMGLIFAWIGYMDMHTTELLKSIE